MSTPGMGASEMHGIPIGDIVRDAETVGMRYMGDEPFTVIEPDMGMHGVPATASNTHGIADAGTYPPDSSVTAYTYPSLFDRLPEFAQQINQDLKGAGFPESESLTRQMLAIAEEAGEFAGAVRRFYGMARRSGTFEELLMEWADLIITGFVTANTLGLSRAQMEKALDDKLHIIFARGWHESPGQLSTDDVDD